MKARGLSLRVCVWGGGGGGWSLKFGLSQHVSEDSIINREVYDRME